MNNETWFFVVFFVPVTVFLVAMVYDKINDNWSDGV